MKINKVLYFNVLSILTITSLAYPLHAFHIEVPNPKQHITTELHHTTFDDLPQQPKTKPVSEIFKDTYDTIKTKITNRTNISYLKNPSRESEPTTDSYQSKEKPGFLKNIQQKFKDLAEKTRKKHEAPKQILPKVTMPPKQTKIITQQPTKFTFQEPNLWQRLKNHFFKGGKDIKSTMQKHNENIKNEFNDFKTPEQQNQTIIFKTTEQQHQVTKFIEQDPNQFLKYLNQWVKTNETMKNKSLQYLEPKNKEAQSIQENRKKEKETLNSKILSLSTKRDQLTNELNNQQATFKREILTNRIKSLTNQINSTQSIIDLNENVNRVADETMKNHQQTNKNFFDQRLINFQDEMQNLLPKNLHLQLMFNQDTRQFEYHRLTTEQ